MYTHTLALCLPKLKFIWLNSLQGGSGSLVYLRRTTFNLDHKKTSLDASNSLPLNKSRMHNNAVPSIYTCTHISKNTTIRLLYMKKNSKVQSSFALPFRDGIHIHMGVIQVYTSQSESDFVRYIHMVSLKFAVPTQGTRSVLHIRCRNNLLQIGPSLCPNF